MTYRGDRRCSRCGKKTNRDFHVSWLTSDHPLFALYKLLNSPKFDDKDRIPVCPSCWKELYS